MLREQNNWGATRRDLNGAGDDTNCEDLPVACDDLWAAQARAHAVARGFDPEFSLKEQGMGLIGETLRVRTRDGAYLSGVVIRTDGGMTGPIHVHAGYPERKDLAGAQRTPNPGR